MLFSNFVLVAYFLVLSAAAVSRERPPIIRGQKGSTISLTSAPIVDLGYAIYEGYYNSTSELNIFKGYVPYSPLSQQITSELVLTGNKNTLCSTTSRKFTMAETTTAS
jgi:hypothetical protein